MIAREVVVGREPELRRLDEALARGQAGQPTVVLVSGAPGTGKSLLVSTIGERVQGVVVATSCDPAEIDLDFGVVDALIRAAPLDPAVAAAARPHPSSDPLEAGAALLRVLDGLPLAGVTVVVDDAHWADAASLATLTFVARRLRAENAVLCVACRSTELDRLPDGLVRLADHHGARIDLGPLDAPAVGQLARSHLGRPLPAAAVERLHAHTAGNPLHVRSLVRELSHDVLVGPGDLPAPRSYALWVVARVASCGPDVRQLVESLAVLGNRAPLATVGAVAGVGDLLAGVDGAVAAELVRVEEAPGARLLAVSHPLVRAAVLDDMAPSRSAALHRAAGEVLDGTAGLRHLLVGTTVPDAALAARARSVAHDEEARGAHGAAGRVLLETARVEPDRERADHDLLEGVDQHLLAGDLRRAATLRPAVAALPAGARRDAVLGHLAYVLGPRRDAGRHLDAAWDACDQADAGLAGHIAALQATLAVDRRDGPRARAWALRARELAPRRAAAAHAGHMLAMGHALGGTLAAGIDELSAALAELRTGADGPEAGDLHLGRGVLRLWAHDLAGAADDLAACLADGVGGALVTRETARYSLADVHYRAGRWDAALVTAELAASLADAGDQAWIAPFPHSVATYVQAGRGAWDRAEAHLAAASEAVKVTAGGAAGLWVALATMRLAEARADHTAVVEVGDLLAAAGRFRFDEGIVPWRGAYAEALAAQGRLADAAAVVAWLADDADGTTSALVRSDVARASAAVALAGGDASTAAATAIERLGDATAGPFARARLGQLAGRACWNAGDRDRATQLLGAARRRFSSLGAAPWAARVDADLRATGSRPARRDRHDPVALTRHEVAVVHVVAEGRSNREAAAALYVSVKTVEHHLTRAYAKLGVRSRTELTRLVRRGGVAGLTGDEASPDAVAGGAGRGAPAAGGPRRPGGGPADRVPIRP